MRALPRGRARREMTALLSRVPRTAIRHRDGELEEVRARRIEPGDRLLIRQGDVVPVDGTVAEGVARARPVGADRRSRCRSRRWPGEAVMSGSTNAGEAFDMWRRGRRPRAPMPASSGWSRRRSVRGRRCRGWPTVTRSSSWCLRSRSPAPPGGLSGDPIRAVAVLVVATPCPLILAVPVAMSRAFRAPPSSAS